MPSASALGASIPSVEHRVWANDGQSDSLRQKHTGLYTLTLIRRCLMTTAKDVAQTCTYVAFSVQEEYSRHMCVQARADLVTAHSDDFCTHALF